MPVRAAAFGIELRKRYGASFFAPGVRYPRAHQARWVCQVDLSRGTSVYDSGIGLEAAIVEVGRLALQVHPRETEPRRKGSHDSAGPPDIVIYLHLFESYARTCVNARGKQAEVDLSRRHRFHLGPASTCLVDPKALADTSDGPYRIRDGHLLATLRFPDPTSAANF